MEGCNGVGVMTRWCSEVSGYVGPLRHRDFILPMNI